MAETWRAVSNIADILDPHLEWLVVRENGRTLQMLRSEIEVTNPNGVLKLGFVGENGLIVRDVHDLELDGVELVVPKSKASLCLYQTEEKPAHLHLAFAAETRQQVEAFYRAALAAGGGGDGAAVAGGAGLRAAAVDAAGVKGFRTAPAHAVNSCICSSH